MENKYRTDEMAEVHSWSSERQANQMRKNKLSTYCNCENCTNCRCQEDKYTCKDKTVIDGYMPTQDYYYCRGERFDRKKV